MATATKQTISVSSCDDSAAVPPPLAPAIQQAAAFVVERVLTELLGNVYSPRIKLLDLHQVCQITRLSKSTIFALMQTRKFPRPQRNLGKRLWRESTLIRWLDANDPNLE